MSLSDEIARINELSNKYGFGDVSSDDVRVRGLRTSASYLVNLDNLLSQDIGTVTSRDDIINVDDILDAGQFKNTKEGKKLYEQYRNALIAYRDQQQASYDEWYESPEQIALREREAGRNPDLIDGVLGSGSAAQTATPEGSPIEGIPTDGETASVIGGTAVAAIGAIVSAVATLAALPATLAGAAAAQGAKNMSDLTAAQAGAQELANISNYEKLVGGEISNRFADAAALAAQSGDTSFSVDSWFSHEPNFDGIAESYLPPQYKDDSRYAAAFSRARNRVQQTKAVGYGIAADAAFGQTEFSSAVKDPYFSFDLLTQMAYMEPVMNWRKQMDDLTRQFELTKLNLKKTYVDGIDGDLAAENFNKLQQASFSKAGYDVNYFDGLDGSEVAAIEMFIKRSDKFRRDLKDSIDRNYFDIWKDKSRPYDQRMSAAYLLNGDVSKKWYDWTIAYNLFELTPSASPDTGFVPAAGVAGSTAGSAINFWKGATYFDKQKFSEGGWMLD